MSAVVAINNVTRSFPGPPEVHAVRGVDLTILDGEYVSIIGPSGSGKSTLLHLIGLLDRPTSGTYFLDGVDVTKLRERQRARFRGRQIGFVFQSFHLLPNRPVLDNVMLPLAYQRVPRRKRRERALAALDQVGMSHRVNADPATLSGGERQRVAIARALVVEPRLLLADEPTGNLDSATAASVLGVFERLHGEGLTLAVITHDDSVSARAQRRIRLSDGLLAEQVTM
jgi:putative ABC transport system ATP-binding protein